MKRIVLIFVLLVLDFLASAQVRTAQVDLVVNGADKALPWLCESKGLLFYTLDAEYTSGTEMRFESTVEGFYYMSLMGTDSRTLELSVFYCGPTIDVVPPLYSLVLDDTRGRDYLCLVYSDSPIDANRLAGRYAAAKGNFYARMEAAIAGQRADAAEVRYVQNRIGVTSRSGGMVPLYIEVEHR